MPKRITHTKSPNARRAEAGDRALDHQIIEQDIGQWGALIDTLANLRHMCDRDYLDFAAADKLAYQHYTNEKYTNRGRSA